MKLSIRPAEMRLSPPIVAAHASPVRLSSASESTARCAKPSAGVSTFHLPFSYKPTPFSVAGLDRPIPDMPTQPVSEEAPVSNTTRAEYLAMVETAKDYIRAGDIFQVVPSQRFRLPFALPPVALYRALRRTNPSPYMFFLDFEDFALVGSSPETLVRLLENKVTIRPIAGTRSIGCSL